jgi:hypothetical protein
MEVAAEGGRIADMLEHQAMQSITGLRGLLDGLKAVPGRKLLLVVSAGIPTSTKPSGRPNVSIETDEIGRRAAAANVSLYVLYMNVHFLRAFSAEYGRTNTSIFHDVTMFGQGLERFSNSAGGTFFQVQVQADPFVARAMRESSASYVLTVQALPAERDGKEHFIRVETKQRGADLRYRRIVIIPKEKFEVRSSKYVRYAPYVWYVRYQEPSDAEFLYLTKKASASAFHGPGVPGVPGSSCESDSPASPACDRTSIAAVRCAPPLRATPLTPPS